MDTMLDLLFTIAVTIFTLLLLVGVHEFGHFWVARRCGVGVLRFSIGFGPALYRWEDRMGTDFVLAAIPLGGYVRMVGAPGDDVPEKYQHLSLAHKPVGQRIAIVAAGPIANLLLAVLAYWFIFMNGQTGMVPLVGKVESGSVAAMAGVRPGQEITAVDGRETATWRAVGRRLLNRIGESGSLELSLRDPESGQVYETVAQLDNWMAGAEASDLVAGLGIERWTPPVPATVDRLIPGGPADLAGLRPGDRVIAANGAEVSEWADWVEQVRASPSRPMNLRVDRGGDTVLLTVVPESVPSEGRPIGRVGVSVRAPEWPPHAVRETHYGPLEALAQAVRRTGQVCLFTFDAIGKMLEGLISPKNLSGPVTIAKVAGDSAQSGLEPFIAFLALLSVSLGVLNLLPIPVLDGGHLLYYMIELLAGRPLPLKVQLVGYQIGMVLILGIMTLAIYNDVARF